MGDPTMLLSGRYVRMGGRHCTLGTRTSRSPHNTYESKDGSADMAYGYSWRGNAYCGDYPARRGTDVLAQSVIRLALGVSETYRRRANMTTIHAVRTWKETAASGCES